MNSHFQSFDGESFVPIPDDNTPIPTRRMTDTSLEIIAHKLSRIAADLTQVKEDNAKAIDRLEQSMRYTHATLTEATDKAAKAAETAKEDVKGILGEVMANAFPDGDVSGHRAAHESWIRKVDESAAFWRKMREELTKYGLIAFLGFVAVSAWQSFLQGPHK